MRVVAVHPNEDVVPRADVGDVLEAVANGLAQSAVALVGDHVHRIALHEVTQDLRRAIATAIITNDDLVLRVHLAHRVRNLLGQRLEGVFFVVRGQNDVDHAGKRSSGAVRGANCDVRFDAGPI